MAEAPHGEELAVHQPRFSLLDSVKAQLSSGYVSRLFFGFSVVDEASQQAARQELEKFLAGIEATKDSDKVTGVMLGLGSWAVTLLEGPTDSLFQAFTHLHNAQQAAAEEKKQGMRIGPLSLLHLVELRGVRVYPWFVYVPCPSKPEGTSFEDTVPERIFGAYQSVLTFGCKLLDALQYPDPEDKDAEVPQPSDKTIAAEALELAKDKEIGQILPKHDTLDTIVASGQVMSYQAFYDVFLGPIHLELESTKLWPVPPPLAY